MFFAIWNSRLRQHGTHFILPGNSAGSKLDKTGYQGLPVMEVRAVSAAQVGLGAGGNGSLDRSVCG